MRHVFTVIHAGFTPMVKVLRDTLSSQLASREGNSLSSSSSSSSGCPERKDQCIGGAKTAKLVFANKTEKDILWKEELTQFAKASQGR